MKQVKRSCLSVLVGYLCLVMATGCSTVEMHLIDPIETIKFEKPLAHEIAVDVTVDYQNNIKDHAKKDFCDW